MNEKLRREAAVVAHWYDANGVNMGLSWTLNTPGINVQDVLDGVRHELLNPPKGGVRVVFDVAV